MKIIITGSLGHVSKPLTEELVKKGHSVTVISSNAEKQKDIQALGAKAAIGSIEDVSFLTATFSGADAVYCMLPPGHKDAGKYVEAIRQSAVKRIVYLSSIGAHTDKGNGIIAFHYNAEQIMKKLPADVSITFMRPVGFYYNMLNFINTIKTQGVIASNYGGDDMIPWVSPTDIAAAITEELTTSFNGRKVRYVASEEITCNEVAHILGTAIGKPDLKWILITNEQLQSDMIAMGVNPQFAAGLVEMNAAQHSGALFEDYYRNRPALGKVKVKDFAKEFAVAFNQK
jgi:uncharacterized protein YbjT (DUF2867 family)